MAFEDLREQLSEKVAEAAAKVQESSAFNTLREHYESQTPVVQKAITVGGLALVALFLLMFPLSYISSGSESLAAFEENRELIQGLLRASRSANEPSPLPPPMSSDMLRGSIENLIRQNGLLPDQTTPIQDTPADAFKAFTPAGVTSTIVAVPLKKLNLMQVIEIGNLLQNQVAMSGVKIMGIDVVQSAGQTHYYDMILQVASFGIPALTGGDDESSARGNTRGRPAAGSEEFE